MSIHHMAFAARDIHKTHAFYEGVMGFELVKVEVAPLPTGGWGKHFFYRIKNNDGCFIAFWELNDVPGDAEFETNLNKAANLPEGTNHFAFGVETMEELMDWKDRWHKAGLDVLEIDHNWCHSVYTRDPDGNPVEFCLTTGVFTEADRTHALNTIDETEFKPSPAPAKIEYTPAAEAAE